jgi:hypothetical protein
LDNVRSEPISNLIADVFDSRFGFNEEQHQTEFMQEEGQRQIHFSEAESGREEAERARATALEQQETSRDQAYQAMMSMHQDSFEGSEASRGWKEEWRARESEEAEEHRIQSFRQALALIEKQFHALNDLEADAVQFMKSKSERLNKMNRALFERGRQQRSAAFSLSQARRELELLMPSWKVENDEEVIIIPHRRRVRSSTRRSRSWSRSRYPMAHMARRPPTISMEFEYDLEVPVPRPVPAGFSPPTGFVGSLFMAVYRSH